MTVDGILKRRCGAWSTVERIRRQLARKGMGEWKKLLKRLFVGVIKKESKKRVCGGGVLCLEAMERRGEKYDFMGGTSSDGTGLLDNVFLFRYNAVVDGLSCG